MKMSEKQKKFCDYFIETGNVTKAASEWSGVAFLVYSYCFWYNDIM